LLPYIFINCESYTIYFNIKVIFFNGWFWDSKKIFFLHILENEFYSALMIIIPMLERLQNIVYDTNYTAVITNGGFVVSSQLAMDVLTQKKKKKADAFGRMDTLLQKIGLTPAPKKP